MYKIMSYIGTKQDYNILEREKMISSKSISTVSHTLL